MLKKILSGAAMVLVCTALARADNASDLKTAVDKLATATSFTCTSDTKQAAGGQSVSSQSIVKVEKNGYTYLKGGRSGAPATTEFVIEGNNLVMFQAGKWMTLDELIGGNPQLGANAALMKATLQNGVKQMKDPISALSGMIGKLQNVQKDGSDYTGTLGADDMKQMLAKAMGGNPALIPDVSGMTSTYRMSVANGTLSKMESHTTGTLNPSGRAIPIDLTVTTAFSEVNSTKADPPADAKAKLDALPASTQP